MPSSRTIAAIAGLVAFSTTMLAQPLKRAAPMSDEEDRIVIRKLYDGPTLNLITSNDDASLESFNYVYESLTHYDPKTLGPIPWLAESLPKISDDKLSYEVTLRKNARFSDGKPITGLDVIFYLKLAKNRYFVDAASTRRYFRHLDRAELIDDDPYRIRFVMDEPYYLGHQTIGAIGAAPRHLWDPKGLTDQMTFSELNEGGAKLNRRLKQYADWFLEEIDPAPVRTQVGSGPYKYERWDKGDSIVLIRDEQYWNRGHRLAEASPKRIILRVIRGLTDAIAAFRNGDLDFVPHMETTLFIDLLKDKSLTDAALVTYEFPSYAYIGYNQRNPIFADTRVRRAMSHAVSVDSIIAGIYYGYAVPVRSPIMRRRPEHDSTIPAIRYDLMGAGRILHEAGWGDSNGDGILDKMIGDTLVDFRFTILVNSGNIRRLRIANRFVDALHDIGISASTAQVKWTEFQERIKDREYDVVINEWAQNPVEMDLYGIWHSASIENDGSNYVSFRNDRVDSLIEQLHDEFDFQKRLPLYREIQRIIHEEQPYTFLVSERYMAIYRRRFTNVNFFFLQPCYDLGRWHIIPQKK
jgi:peptide/nickel transport system substrate-binding protein